MRYIRKSKEFRSSKQKGLLEIRILDIGTLCHCWPVRQRITLSMEASPRAGGYFSIDLLRCASLCSPPSSIYQSTKDQPGSALPGEHSRLAPALYLTVNCEGTRRCRPTSIDLVHLQGYRAQKSKTEREGGISWKRDALGSDHSRGVSHDCRNQRRLEPSILRPFFTVRQI